VPQNRYGLSLPFSSTPVAKKFPNIVFSDTQHPCLITSYWRAVQEYLERVIEAIGDDDVTGSSGVAF